MDIEQYNEETINYIYGELSKKEEAAFKEKLKADPALAEDVFRLRKGMDEVRLGFQMEAYLNDPDLEKAERMAEEAINAYEEKKRKKQSRTLMIKLLIPVAAVIALFIVLRVNFLGLSPDIFYQKYYMEYTSANYSQAEIDKAKSLYSQSIQAYEDGNYLSVANNMNIFWETGRVNKFGEFLKDFNEGRRDAAEELGYGSDDTNSFTREDAHWHLALSAYKLKDYPKAEEICKEISQDKSNKNARKAKKLLKKIQNL